MFTSGFESFTTKGVSKNLALLVFTLPNFIFLPEGRGVLSMSRYFSHRLPS
jgi:hypothetical protein